MKKIFALIFLFVLPASFAGDMSSRDLLVHKSLATADGTWRGVVKTPVNASSRDLFIAALIYCEAHTNLFRLGRLFDVAAEMQDRDASPKNKNYGNFLWYYNRPPIVDRNAVDFCMQPAAPMWILHRDKIPQDSRDKLQKLIELGIEGCKRHRVGDEYTNIALMSAVNLILLGEAMNRPDAAEEGAKRLDSFIAAMRSGGTHEYDSPTYYGVDLDDLVLLESLAKNEKVRAAARSLLEYFWTDIALNWLPGSQKIGGTRSRDYDYLSGLGNLDQHLVANGWLEADEKHFAGYIIPAFTQWHPPANLRAMAETKFPRLVQQIWGPNTNQSRTHFVCRDVSLSSSGAGYGGWMDFPLCVDLPGDRNEPRCIFVPDGRHDPYGKNKIMERSGHMKSLHLSPWWAAVQRKTDAIGLVVYRPVDIATNMSVKSLESHFVMPLRADEFWIGDYRAALTTNSPTEISVPPGTSVILRRGTAAVGVRVPWARNCEGKPIQSKFIYDGNPHGVVRLTVDHGTNFAAMTTNALPAAMFWVRVGSELKDDSAFEAWRTAFARAEGNATAAADRIDVNATGIDGTLHITGHAPFRDVIHDPATTSPLPPRFNLAIDGDDIGRKILDGIPSIAK